MQKKNYEQAEKAFSETIAKSNSSAEVALKLGRVEYVLNNYNEAGKLMEVFYLLAKNAYAAKECGKALDYISISLFLDPDNAKYKELKKSL